MGLFSDKKETVVGSTVMHLMDATTNPSNDSIITVILTSGVPYATRKDIPAYIISSKLKSTASKVPAAQAYAKDFYKLGLPDGGAMGGNPLSSEEIAPYILGETGYPYDIVIEDSSFTEFTPGLAIYEFLLNTRGYDQETDIINNWPSGVTFTSYYGEDTDTFPRKLEIKSVMVNADGISADITYDLYIYRTWTVSTGPSYLDKEVVSEWLLDPSTFVENIPIPAPIPTHWEEDCFFAIYKQLDVSGNVLPTYHTWVYNLDDGLYPEISLEAVTTPDEFMPVIPVRYNNQDLTDPTTQNSPPDPTNLWSTSHELLRKYGMNLETIGYQINQNPDIAEIDNAYVMWGVDVQNNHEPSLFYLTEFFYNQYALQRSSEIDFLNALINPLITQEPSTIYNSGFTNRSNRKSANAFTEYGLALDVKYDYITTSLTSENIGDIEYADKQIVAYTVQIKKIRYDGEAEGVGEEYTINETRHKLILRSQVTNTQVRTVTVFNLTVINWVYGDHNVVTTLAMVTNSVDEHGMVIPLQYNLSTEYELEFRNKLYTDCAILVINSIQIIKVKWYQQAWFKMVLMVVAIIITIWSGGAGSWLAGLAAAVGKGVMATVIYLGSAVLVSLAISYAVDWIVHTFGAKLGIIGAIILTIVAIIASRGMGAFGAASEFMMTTAQYMLQISSALISSANEFLLEEGVKIREDFAAFSEKMDGLWEELEDIQDLLKAKADIDPLTFTRPSSFRVIVNETPTTFYARSLGLVDNTMFTIHDEIHNFMDMRLRLKAEISPEMQEAMSI